MVSSPFGGVRRLRLDWVLLRSGLKLFLQLSGAFRLRLAFLLLGSLLLRGWGLGSLATQCVTSATRHRGYTVIDILFVGLLILLLKCRCIRPLALASSQHYKTYEAKRKR
jgi:hypothetical protein